MTEERNKGGRPLGRKTTAWEALIPCPDCGGRMMMKGRPKSVTGLKDDRRIFRYRRCACGYKVSTVETIVVDPAAIQRLSSELLDIHLKEMEEAGNPIAPFIRDLFKHGTVKG